MELLVIDDDPLIRTATLQMAEDAGHYAEAAADGPSALRILGEARFDLVLLDLQLGHTSGLELLPAILKKYPATSVVMVTGNASIATAVEAMRIGALDFLEKPFTPELLAITLQKARLHRRLTQQVETLSEQISTQQPEASFASSSPAMQRIFEVLFRAADTDASILILGESGTGKTLAARAVHAHSSRRTKPLVTINCPSLSRELIESELFGHVRGAFTGAVRDSQGKVNAADGGSLFLDEVGELPREVQARLLRLLNDREYERVGESQVRRADVRVIAATNLDLALATAQGTFREDLFFRLNVITVTLPPLRERHDDILTFAESYLQFFARQYRRPATAFSAVAKKLLTLYTWPGNLRELRNAIERAVILGNSQLLDTDDLPASIAQPPRPESSTPQPGDPISIEALTDVHLKLILQRTSTLTEAARILGIDEATLYRRRKKSGL